MTLASRRDRDRDQQGQDIYVLNEETAARRANGDSTDRRRKQVTLKTITGEPERVQGPLLGLGQGLAGQGKMAVKMMADQFHALTRLKMDQVWPERRGRAKMEVTMMIDQLQMIVATLQTRHRMDTEATREGEGAEATHTYEQAE